MFPHTLRNLMKPRTLALEGFVFSGANWEILKIVGFPSVCSFGGFLKHTRVQAFTRAHINTQRVRGKRKCRKGFGKKIVENPRVRCIVLSLERVRQFILRKGS